MSSFTDVLLVSPMADGKTWVIRAPFSYEVGELGSGEVIEVPEGFQTDFASVPRPLWPIVSRWGRHGKAAIIHDFAYWDQTYDKKRADEIFREAMGVLGVSGWRKFLIYQAVRWLGGGAWRGNRHRKEQGVDRVQDPPKKAVDERAW